MCSSDFAMAMQSSHHFCSVMTGVFLIEVVASNSRYVVERQDGETLPSNCEVLLDFLALVQ